MSRLLARVSLAAIVVVAGSLLAGCSSTVSMQPAPDANNPLCADVTVKLPNRIGTLERQYTDAQATGAWGDPTGVLLSCGVPVPPPTTMPCQTFKGVDWIIDESQLPQYTATTYGRDPAVEVVIDGTAVSGSIALEDLANAVQSLPKYGLGCTDKVDPNATP
ncbi:MAG TPA: DUF3515 family protein [Microbacteriaceae bacterium]|jgi:hypothetical protein|nr:DUF3515 family protein [Microbacteriaceae bacterium]HQX34741.1 DUF3515 family protein [Microbacteriaceae bacterium]HQZ47943.1 DUF3515 family protein [Microbacteriaceae bacterium]